MERKERTMLVINPISGTGRKDRLVQQVTDKLGREGFDINVRWTTAPGDATAFASEAAEKGYDSVLVAGGDGTVNETAKALRDTSVAMGIIPVGSGNGLARHINIPIDAEASLKVIAARKVVDCDYAMVNDRPFFCTFGLGLDAVVAHNFARQGRRGLVTYANSFINEFLKYHPETYTISANGKVLTEKAMIIACCNASQYGNNVYIAPHASITDGLLDITIIHQGTPIDTALMGMDLFTGYIDKNTLIHTFRAPAAVIYRNSEGPAHIDGEPVVLDEILDVKCHRSGLRLFVNPDKKPFRPIITPTASFWKGVGMAFGRLFAVNKK